ncbi:MAG: Crp/Fnr family transcriptional regulator [Proteobacteria bacterium]|nr:Crp/Fnr family transcriptional regulator [Pseudomonadota bacterium]
MTIRSVLTDDERDAVLALPAHAIKIRARQDFVHLSEETNYSCLIASGLVGRFGQTSTGVRQITAFHLPGDMADLNSAVRPIGLGGLNALCETVILRIPHDAIRVAATRFPALAEAFWRDCLLDSAILMQWVVNVGRRDARTRLAHILCEMSIRSGRDREILLNYQFPATQEQIADAAALTSVHVNRSLKSLRNTGLATVSGGRVEIHDWDGLARAGEFDSTYLVADTIPERQKRMLAT